MNTRFVHLIKLSNNAYILVLRVEIIINHILDETICVLNVKNFIQKFRGSHENPQLREIIKK